MENHGKEGRIACKSKTVPCLTFDQGRKTSVPQTNEGYSSMDLNKPESRFFSEPPDKSLGAQCLDVSLTKLRASDLQNCEMIGKRCKSPYLWLFVMIAIENSRSIQKQSLHAGIFSKSHVLSKTNHENVTVWFNPTITSQIPAD